MLKVGVEPTKSPGSKPGAFTNLTTRAWCKRRESNSLSGIADLGYSQAVRHGLAYKGKWGEGESRTP